MNARKLGTAEPARTAARAGGRLQRKCRCGTHTGGSRCPQCAPVGPLQPRLWIGASNDPLESEADRLATQVLATPSTLPVQATTAATPSLAAATMSDSVNRVLADAGHPMPTRLRQDMEGRFGHDFSQVRLHTDPVAQRSAQDMHAAAYAVGPHLAFGSGRYAPQTREGRWLLAHELAHVIQQAPATTLTLRRVPDAGVDAPSDAGVDAPSDAGPAPAAPATGTAGAQPAPAAPTRAPGNEDEAREDTALVYPTDDAVSAAIAQLPEVVRKELGTDVGYQRKFLYRTALYLGPHPLPLEHFKRIGQFTFADRTRLYLHEDAISHLNDVQSVIGADNMPSSGTGFALRDLIRRTAVPPPGLMVHAMGYAIDFRAVLNPHIKDRRLVAVQALYAPDPVAYRIATGKWATRRGTIKKMGRGELGEDAPERKDFIERFRKEAVKDLLGNFVITHQIPASGLATLKALRGEYKQWQARQQAFRKDVAAAKKKLKRGQSLNVSPLEAIGIMLDPNDPRAPLLKEGASLLQTRQSIIERTRNVLGDLVGKTDAQIKAMKAIPHVAESDKDYAAALKAIDGRRLAAHKALASIERALARSVADARRHAKAAERLKARIKTEKSATRRTALEARKQRETDAQSDALRDVVAGEVKRAFAARAEATVSSELQEARGVKGKRRWLDQLEMLEQGLSVEHFDARLVFGIGDRHAEADEAVRDPSLIQLFSKGFFNIDPPPPSPPPGASAAPTKKAARPARGRHGFDLAFMEEMAKHGFDQGSEWEPGGIDSMHFEYAEGVDKLHAPAPTTGGTPKPARQVPP